MTRKRTYEPPSTVPRSRPLGERVRELRKKKRMTQAELADKAKVKQSTISRLEMGKIDDLGSAHLRKLAEGLGVMVEELFSDPREVPSSLFVNVNPDAKRLVRYYKNLSDDAKRELLNYAEFLYTKDRENWE